VSSLLHVLNYVGIPACILALGTFAWRVSRAVLLHRAGATALKHGSKDPCGKAGLKIVEALTRESEPWSRAILSWRRSDDES
jgi:hypothetical protein